MEDRYLYRAKRTDNGEWVQGVPFEIEGKQVILIKDNENLLRVHYLEENMWNAEIYVIEVDKSTICQCTGLRDKNGKLIWENDIVKKEFYTDYDNCANSEEYIGIVKITDCAWVIETIRDKCTRPIFETMSYSEDVKHFEIIGNVFDNPELLESEE